MQVVRTEFPGKALKIAAEGSLKVQKEVTLKGTGKAFAFPRTFDHTLQIRAKLRFSCLVTGKKAAKRITENIHLLL